MAVADVNGDGQLDVVAITDSGDLWALDGKTGATLAPFPIRTGGAVRTAPLVVDLSPVGVEAWGDG